MPDTDPRADKSLGVLPNHSQLLAADSCRFPDTQDSEAGWPLLSQTVEPVYIGSSCQNKKLLYSCNYFDVKFEQSHFLQRHVYLVVPVGHIDHAPV